MNTLELQNLGLEEMNEKKMVEVDGGAVWLVWGACALLFGAGVYVGYKETEQSFAK